MCLGIPSRVLSVEGTTARVDVRGRVAVADARMVPVRVGDYVLVYAGLITEVLDPRDAEERLRALPSGG